jgi:hypothetical protein
MNETTIKQLWKQLNNAKLIRYILLDGTVWASSFPNELTDSRSTAFLPEVLAHGTVPFP